MAPGRTGTGPGGPTARWLAAGAALLALFALPRASRADPACAPRPTDPADIQTVAHWILQLQYRGASLPSDGAVRVHHTPGYQAPDGTPYFQVVPYRANLAMRGLLRAPVAGKLEAIEAWIDWYLSHLTPGPLPGVVLDHWYRADGTGETTAPPGAPAALRNFDDASDSDAATFLGLVQAYSQEGGRRAASFLGAAGIKQKLETIAAVILSLQQKDGLTWAKSSYPVKYTMDNCEVYWGLQSMALLEADRFGDTAAAQRYQRAAARVRGAVLTLLFDARRGLYRVARFADDSFAPADLSTWYPGTTALAWPHLFGVAAPHSAVTQAQMAALDQSWGGSSRPDWTTQFVDPSGFPWTSIGCAALLAGDCARARVHVDLVKRLKFPAAPGQTGFDWPFGVDDAGWLLMTLTQRAPAQ